MHIQTSRQVDSVVWFGLVLSKLSEEEIMVGGDGECGDGFDHLLLGIIFFFIILDYVMCV